MNETLSQDAKLTALRHFSHSLPVGYVYANLPASVTLQANHPYYLLSQETSGGDQWYDCEETISVTSDIAAYKAAWDDWSGYQTQLTEKQQGNFCLNLYLVS